jgi:hypothetical protein
MKGVGRFAVGVLALLAGVGLVGALLARRVAEGGLADLEAGLDGLRAWGWIARLTLVAVVVGGWPRWVEGAARRGHWPAARTAAVMAWRWRALGWFAGFEILFVQHGFGRLVRWLAG